MFRRQARAWLGENAEPYRSPPVSPSAIVAEWSEHEEEQRLGAARAWQARKFDAGWAGIAWPVEYGGRGGTPIQQVIFGQEEARYDVPRDALVVGTGWCGPAIMLMGSEAQRRRYLPRLLRGDEVWCQLFSEPGAGSDLAGLETRAVPDGDEWLITGEKVWTTFAHRSDRGLCVARHDPDAPRHRGLTAFVVDMRADGVDARPLRQMTGASNFNQVFLDQVRLPDSSRIGGVGDGWRVVITTFTFERTAALFSAAPMLDALRREIEARPVTPEVRDAWVRLFVADRALGYTGLRVLTSISQGHSPGMEGSLLKLMGTGVMTDLYDLALTVLGPQGLLTGTPVAGEWQAAFLGAPGLRIGGGTDEVQRNIIGERILGLPRDPRPV